MVYYFKSRCGEYTLYMGKDKYENEHLIRYGWPEDVWFHVDDLSSAHVYLRLKPDMTLDDLTTINNGDLLTDCAALVKANSIQGCKKNNVYVVYTRWKNLKKTNDMVDGQVSFHRPENVRRINVEKHNSIVRQIEKTKQERFPDLALEQQQREREIQLQKKAEWKKLAKEQQQQREEALQQKEARSYNHIMREENMSKNSEIQATVDSSAAEAYEDDFF